MITIEVCKRLNDFRLVPKKHEDGSIVVSHGVVEMTHGPKFHAQIKGRPGCWAAGDTHDEAVGDLIRCHPEEFGIKVEYLGELHR